MASSFDRTPRPRTERRLIQYPQLTSGTLLALVGMGLAASCGGASPSSFQDGGTNWGTGGGAGTGGATSIVPPHDGGADPELDADSDAGDAG